MKPNTIIFVTIGVLLIAGGAYYISTKKAEAPTASQNQQNQTETTNWKTYKSAKFGFEFKYPSDWISEEQANGVLLKSKEPIYEPPYPGGEISVEDIDTSHPTLDSIKNEPYITWQSDITVDGQRAIHGTMNESSGTAFLYIVYKGKLYIFSSDLAENEIILGSFKFTN